MVEDGHQWRLNGPKQPDDHPFNSLLSPAYKGENKRKDDSSCDGAQDVWQSRLEDRSFDLTNWYAGSLDYDQVDTHTNWHETHQDSTDDSTPGQHHKSDNESEPDASAHQYSLSHYCNNKLYECRDCGLLTVSRQVLRNHQDKGSHPPLHLPTFRCPASSCPNTFRSLQSLKVHLDLDHQVVMRELDAIVSFALDNCGPSPAPSASVGEIKEGVSNDKSRDCDNEESRELRSIPTQVSDNVAGSPSFNWTFHHNQASTSEGSEGEGQTMQEEDLPLSSSEESEVDSDTDVDAEIPPNDSLDTTESIKKHIDLMNLIKKEKTAAHRCLMSVKCRLRFKSLNTLDYHKKCHDLAKKCWKCPECGISFSVWNSLALHLWNKHTIDMELYYCNLCSFRTPNLSQLKTNHMWIHSGLRRFTCSLCSKSVKTRKQLRNHQAVHKKTGRGRYECKGCRALFSRRSLLKQHHLTVHQNTRNYRCSVCSHRSASRSAHDLHFRKHTKEKKYACGECSYTTGDHNALRRHLATHSGHRPYSCPHCSYTSIHSTSLRAHLNSKHPGMLSDVVFSCPLCPFSSLRKDLFVSHTASKHSLHSPLLASLSQDQDGGNSSSVSTVQTLETPSK